MIALFECISRVILTHEQTPFTKPKKMPKNKMIKGREFFNGQTYKSCFTLPCGFQKENVSDRLLKVILRLHYKKCSECQEDRPTYREFRNAFEERDYYYNEEKCVGGTNSDKIDKGMGCHKINRSNVKTIFNDIVEKE